MPSLDRAASLHSLLLTPGIHRGIVDGRSRRLATGVDAVDTLLHGGLPAGAITEIVGARTSGKTTLAYALAAAFTRRGAFVAYIDVADAFDPEHAAAAGVRLPRTLWIRPGDVRAALRAAEHVVETGGFLLVLIDCGDRTFGRADPSSAAWLRLSRTTAAAKAAVVVLDIRRVAGISAAARLELAAGVASFSGDGGRFLFDGIATLVECQKNKLGPLASSPTRLIVAAG